MFILERAKSGSFIQQQVTSSLTLTTPTHLKYRQWNCPLRDGRIQWILANDEVTRDSRLLQVP